MFYDWEDIYKRMTKYLEAVPYFMIEELIKYAATPANATQINVFFHGEIRKELLNRGYRKRVAPREETECPYDGWYKP